MGVRNFKDAPRVYIDMDGPMAAYEAALHASGVEPKDYKHLPGVFRSLAVVAGACDAVAAIEALGLDVFILTKIPLGNPLAATEKLQWVQEHFPALLDKVIISSDKAAVGTTRDFLVDDHPEWANAHNFSGTVVSFTAWPAAVEVIREVMATLAWKARAPVAPVCVLNAVLSQETDTQLEVEEGTSPAEGSKFLRLYLRAGEGTKQRLFVTAFPRESSAGALVAAGAAGQFFYQLGAAHGALRRPVRS